MQDEDLLASAESEANLIWSRYNAMVVADTIFIAALGSVSNNELAFWGAIVGIVLTTLWWLITSAGWSFEHFLLGKTSSASKTLLNTYGEWNKSVWPRLPGDPIWFFAHLVIAVFYIVFSLLALHFGRKAFDWTVWPVWGVAIEAFVLVLLIVLSLSKFSINRRH